MYFTKSTRSLGYANRATKRKVAGYCRDNISRLKRYAYRHSKVSGVHAFWLNDWISLDCFKTEDEIWHIHAMNLFSKFSLVKTLASGQAPSGPKVVEFLEECRRHNLTARNCLTDMGPEFNNSEVSAWLTLHNITHWQTPPGAPWTHGGVERRHRTIKECRTRMNFLYAGRTKTAQVVMEVVTAINQQSTATLDGLSPWQFHYCSTPSMLDPPPPEDQNSSTVKTGSLAFENYAIRCKAREVLEGLKADRAWLDTLKKLEEQTRYKFSLPIKFRAPTQFV